MKAFIIGIALFFVFMIFTIYQYDYNFHQEQVYNLKFVAEEVAAGAAQYILIEDFTEGKLIFNQSESIKAVEYILQKNLKLNSNLFPESNSYWQEQINYEIKFFDDSNTAYPYLYEDVNKFITLTITDPTVVITINAGKPRYRLLDNPPIVISTAAHEWKGR
ncbi:MAG: hypothetical protein AB7V16_04460 [Vulcanibacillus sp.]